MKKSRTTRLTKKGREFLAKKCERELLLWAAKVDMELRKKEIQK